MNSHFDLRVHATPVPWIFYSCHKPVGMHSDGSDAASFNDIQHLRFVIAYLENAPSALLALKGACRAWRARAAAVDLAGLFSTSVDPLHALPVATAERPGNFRELSGFHA